MLSIFSINFSKSIWVSNRGFDFKNRISLRSRNIASTMNCAAYAMATFPKEMSVVHQVALQKTKIRRQPMIATMAGSGWSALSHVAASLSYCVVFL